MGFGTVRVQFCDHAWCTRILRLWCFFSFGSCRRRSDTSYCCLPDVLCCPPADVCIPWSIPNMFVLGVKGVVFYVVWKRNSFSPRLPRSCSIRVVCTKIMTKSGILANCGQLRSHPTLAPHRSWRCALECSGHLLHLSGDVASFTQATVPSRSWDSVRNVAQFPAQSRTICMGSALLFKQLATYSGFWLSPLQRQE